MNRDENGDADGMNLEGSGEDLNASAESPTVPTSV